jgi:membrane-bound lytic murein transglycosylase B
LELRRDKGVIYCFGSNKGFLAQAEDMHTLAQRIRQALPDKAYFIPEQKDFTTDELYNLAKLLQKNVDNTTTT